MRPQHARGHHPGADPFVVGVNGLEGDNRVEYWDD